MTNTQLKQVGYIVVNRGIQKVTYEEYLNTYGEDDTTSPHGVQNRLYIREGQQQKLYRHGMSRQIILTEDEYNDLSSAEQELYDEQENYEYQIWTWGVAGNTPSYTGISFSDMEDAELYLYDCMESYISNNNWDAPIFHDSYSEAVTDMAESLERPKEVVIRYLALAAITERKDAERRAQEQKERDERKAWLDVEVPKEAASIAIDDEFKTALQWAGQASGNEKSQRYASAMKGLLERNGKEKITTDFWQVFRILKSQSDLV